MQDLQALDATIATSPSRFAPELEAVAERLQLVHIQGLYALKDLEASRKPQVKPSTIFSRLGKVRLDAWPETSGNRPRGLPRGPQRALRASRGALRRLLPSLPSERNQPISPSPHVPEMATVQTVHLGPLILRCRGSAWSCPPRSAQPDGRTTLALLRISQLWPPPFCTLHTILELAKVQLNLFGRSSTRETPSQFPACERDAGHRPFRRQQGTRTTTETS